jgi:hypothetical protein
LVIGLFLGFWHLIFGHSPFRITFALTILFPLSLAAQPGPSISHSPSQPRSGQPVTITANLPELTSAILKIQVVPPGGYVRKTDPTFESTWREIPLEKHGPNFVASIPREFQNHRTLVRYRIESVANNKPFHYPARTNLVPNFSYFVYDGLPAWKGASQPGSPLLTFSPQFLGTLPAYHLIANEADVKRSQWSHNANRQPFFGTLIYDGRVYDHIQFHNRGQASTYVAGKNKWGIKFNPGQGFNAGLSPRGEPYAFKWSGLNLNPCASAWAPVNRGMAGLDEALSYRVYQLAGVPSPDTFWIQFRVVDSAEENPKNQYNSDLWGLYLVVQEKNGTWLRENNLPDGNIYNPESGAKYHAPGAPEPTRDYAKFRDGSSRRASEQWWRANLHLPAYYSFHAVNRFVANIDLRPDGNHYLYHRPDGRWVVLPHDLDMMLIPKHHQPGFVPQSYCLQQPNLLLEYKNRAREILDLLASDAAANGGQIGQLVAELSRKLTPAGHERNWPELDEAMWNHHPRTHHRGQFYVTPYNDSRMGGHWERSLATPDFAGFCKYILDFCTDSRPRKNFRPNDGNQLGYGYGYLAHEARDEKIPERPTLRSADNKKFSVSPFSSSAGAKFAGVQWRAAQISAPGLPGYKPGQPCRYEIESTWTTEFTTQSPELMLPPNVVQPGLTYRIRARYKDDTGRCSHWSAPIQFVAAEQ